MSTTAQEQQTLAGSPEPQEAAQTAQAPAAPQEAAQRSSSRSYTIFEEARTDTWTRVTEVEADTQEAAIDSLGETKLKAANGRFMAIPSRFVQPKKPKVTTVTSISYE